MDGTGRLFDRFLGHLPPSLEPIKVSYEASTNQDYESLLQHTLRWHSTDAPFVVISESFSGPIAIRLAAKSPSCRGLILAASFARCPLMLPLWTSRLLGIVRHDLIPTALIEAMLLNGDTNASLANELKQVIDSVPPVIIQERMKAVIGVNAIQEVRDLCVPVLYLQATHDRLVGQRAVTDIKQSARDATVVQIAAPHMILQTQPLACAASISAWLRKNESP